MTDFKSVQDLIIKAAFYDKVSTTISADKMIGAVEGCDGDWYTRGVLSVVRMGYAR